MPTATLTVREVKNKETGLDISIPTYKETPGLLGSTVDFNVVVVSRLSFFKSPKHKEGDVVQFMVPRKYPDFEHLYNQLCEQFPGTILPPLPKKVLRLTEAVIKDRKAKLENFLKFLACTPKLATCSRLLEFLGVSAIKAGRYRKGDIVESDQKAESEDKPEEDEEDVTTATREDLFGEGEDPEEEDMFGGGDEQDLFATTFDSPDSRAGGDARLFEDQDLGGGLEEGEEEELLGFLPDARTPNKTVAMGMQEDNSDLLQIDDDLDKFLVLETKKLQTKEKMKEEENRESKSVTNFKPSLSQKTKPELPQKPALAQKPKLLGKKPALPKKPSVEKASEEEQPNRQLETTTVRGDNPTPALNNDDILKYIQDNASSAEDDLDLFS